MAAASFGNTRMLMLSNLYRYALQFVLLPVFARLLSPTAYGAVAIAMPIVLFGMLLADFGLSSVLIRAEKPEKVEFAAFLGSLGLAAVLTVLAVLLSLTLKASNRDLAGGALLAASPILILSALTVVPSARIQRQGRLGVFALSDVISVSAGAAVGLWGATHGWEEYSLVAQQVTLWTLKLATVGSLAGLRMVPRLDREAMASILPATAAISGANLVLFISRNIGNLLIGLVLGPTPLGFYAVAYQIITIPESVIGQPLRLHVLRGALASGRAGAEAALTDAVRVGVTLTVPTMTIMAMCAPWLVPVVLGGKWLPAILPLMLLAPAGVVHSLIQALDGFSLGMNRAALQLRGSIATSLGGIAGIVVGLAWGTPGVAGGYVIGVSLGASFYLWRITREYPHVGAELLRSLRNPLLAAMTMAAALAVVRGLVVLPPSLTDLLGMLVAAVALYLGALLMLSITEFKRDWILVRGLLTAGR